MPEQQQQQQSSVQSNASGAANGGSWADSFDADTKGWVSGMGLDKLDAGAALAKVLPMYRGAEQKLGVPADQLLRLPGKDAKPEDWRGVYTKLGLPEKPEGYEIKAPDGDSGEFMKQATTWFHEIGVPKGMAQALAGKWNEYVGAQTAAAEGRWNQRFDSEMAELTKEWGDNFNANKDLAGRVERSLGLNRDQLVSMERALGPKAYQQFLARFGTSMGEHRFQGGDGQKQFGMSAEGAKQRIVDLGKDQAFQKKLFAGDADAKAEWTRLHQIAHGNELANGEMQAAA